MPKTIAAQIVDTKKAFQAMMTAVNAQPLSFSRHLKTACDGLEEEPAYHLTEERTAWYNKFEARQCRVTTEFRTAISKEVTAFYTEALRLTVLIAQDLLNQPATNAKGAKTLFGEYLNMESASYYNDEGTEWGEPRLYCVGHDVDQTVAKDSERGIKEAAVLLEFGVNENERFDWFTRIPDGRPSYESGIIRAFLSLLAMPDDVHVRATFVARAIASMLSSEDSDMALIDFSMGREGSTRNLPVGISLRDAIIDMCHAHVARILINLFEPACRNK